MLGTFKQSLKRKIFNPLDPVALTGVKKGHFEPFLAKIAYLRPILASRHHFMNHFNELCHRNCDIRYIRGILEIIKLDFRGIKEQLDAKNVNFRGLIAKNAV